MRVKIAGALVPESVLQCTRANSDIPELRLKLESQQLSNSFGALGPQCLHMYLFTGLQAAENTQIKAILLF